MFQFWTYVLSGLFFSLFLCLFLYNYKSLFGNIHDSRFFIVHLLCIKKYEILVIQTRIKSMKNNLLIRK